MCAQPWLIRRIQMLQWVTSDTRMSKPAAFVKVPMKLKIIADYFKGFSK